MTYMLCVSDGNASGSPLNAQIKHRGAAEVPPSSSSRCSWRPKGPAMALRDFCASRIHDSRDSVVDEFDYQTINQ